MKTTELTYDVAAPPDEVFAELTDFRQLTRWRTLESLRVEPDGPVRVGTKLHTAVKGPGRTMHFVNEVTVIDPQRRLYDDRSVEGTFAIESRWRVEPHSAGSRVHWTTRYEGKGLFRLLSPVLGGIIRRGQLQDLDKFAALIQRKVSS